MKLRIPSIVAVLIVAGAVGGIAVLEFDKSRIRRRIAQLNLDAASVARLRSDSARDQALIDRFRNSAEDGARAMHADLIAAKAELAELQAKAAGSSADPSANRSIEANRDPTTGMTRLEFLSDAGRATPGAAMQTIIWAAMKGREREMAAGVSLDDAARAKAESLLASLPAETRAKYSTPEELVALFFSRGVLDATAVQFAATTITDADHCTLALRVRANGRDAEKNIPMVRRADGWAIAVGENQIDGIRRGLAGEPPPP